MTKQKTALRMAQDQAVKEFIEREVITCEDSHKTYAGKVDNWTKRFEAARSIQGLDWGDDPDKFPKLEPWKYASDIGVPIEAITIRAIVARFVKTILGHKPMFFVSGRGAEDKEDAKVVQEFNEYTLEEEMKFERNFFDILMDTGLTGDGIGKLIEADEEYEWDETYYTIIDPNTDSPVLDPDTANEFDAEEWPNGYPIEVDEDFEPAPDSNTGAIPEVKEIIVTKKDKVYFGTKLIPVSPKDLILPDGADTWNYNELPFVGHKLKKNWHWLKKRVGDAEEGGYDEDIVDKIKPQEDRDKRVSTVPKIDLIEVWGEVDLPTDVNGVGTKVREIIALYAREKGELLGWIPNPYKGRRMFFHWQIMPMPHRARGMSIPQFARGIRDLVDSLVNNMVNRDTINAHAPFVYDEESGFDPEIHEFGPQEFWGVSDKTKLGRLDMGPQAEFRSQYIIEFSMGILQRLFGVTDFSLGTADSSNPASKTARGIQALIGEGNFSFDTMISLLQMTNREFVSANIEMHAKMMREAQMEKKVFFVTESEENPYREIARKKLQLPWNFKPRGTSVNDNIYRKRQDATESAKILQASPLFDPQLTPTTMNNHREVIQNIVDAYDLKTVKLPTPEELRKEMVEFRAEVEMKIKQKQEIEKLKAVVKHRKGTPEAEAAKKVLADIEISGEDPEEELKQMTGGGNGRSQRSGR